MELSRARTHKWGRERASFEAPDTATVRGDLMVILRPVSELVDEFSQEVILGPIAEPLHESESSPFAEVREPTPES